MSLITPSSFQFLSRLAVNNNKPWFEKNRPVYEKARSEFIEWMGSLLENIRKTESIPEKDPPKFVQRIYRDIRFSKNKTPYKSHFSAIIDRGVDGNKLPFYLHIQPGRTILAGGVWDPSPEQLKKIRQEIDYNSKPLMDIMEAREFVKYFGKINGSRLSRPPKGYEADNPQVELLKFKQLYVERGFDDELVLSKKFIPEIMKTYKAALPFLTYFDIALGE